MNELAVTTPILGPDGNPLPVVDELAAAKAAVLAADVSQTVLATDATLSSYGRAEWRRMIFATRKPGDAGAKAKRVASGRAKSKAAKRARRANR